MTDTGPVESSSDAADDTAGDAVNCTSGGASKTVRDGGSFGDGGVVALGSADRPQSIAVDATTVYWTNESSSQNVMQVPIGGGSSTHVASYDAEALTVDAACVHWVDYQLNGVFQAPK